MTPPSNDDWRHCFSLLEKAETLSDSIRFRNKHMPDKLYRYRPMNKYLIDSFPHEKHYITRTVDIFPYLWLSSPSEFNDPYDTWVPYDLERILSISLKDRRDIIIKDVLKYIKDTIDSDKQNEVKEEVADALEQPKPFFSLMKVIKKYKESEEIELIYHSLMEEFASHYYNTGAEDIGVACFSEISDSILMWSHYADYHRGICLEYDKTELLNNRAAEMCIFPVLYEERMPDNGETLFTDEPVEIAGMMYQTLFTKHISWSYEREWRMARPLSQNKNGYEHKIPFILPSAIYMGARISMDDMAEARYLAHLMQRPLYQMRRKFDAYELEPFLVWKPDPNMQKSPLPKKNGKCWGIE